MSGVLNCPVPETIEQKKSMLLKNGIALWDVIASCEIKGSSDSSIKNVIPNDLTPILKGADIERIFVNGKTAEKYFGKYTKNITVRDAICLPSTSPANAAWNLERLTIEWKKLLGITTLDKCQKQEYNYMIERYIRKQG